MASPLKPTAWVSALKREWGLHQLADQHYRFLWDAPPPGEWVALHCQATGHDVAVDRIVAIAALRIVGDRLLTSERLQLAVLPPAGATPPQRAGESGLPIEVALPRLLHFIGSRPLVGYFLDFDLALLNRALQPLLGVPLPLPAFDVSAIFHDWKFRQLPPHQQQGNLGIDLRFATLLRELGLPQRDHHDALDHAVLATLAFVKLRRLQGD